METIKLISGAELKVCPAPFEESLALYDAFLEELAGVKVGPFTELDMTVLKDLLCKLLPSKKIREPLKVCMGRCLYQGLKIDLDTSFEKVEARADYMTVCLEVGKANIIPFTKNLVASYSALLVKLGIIQEQNPES